MIGDGAPAGGRNVRFFFGGNAERYGAVADHAEYAGYGRVCIVSLGNGFDIIRCSYKPVGSAVGTGQHDGAGNAFPVIVDGKLLTEYGRIGHHVIGFVVVDHEFAADVFENGVVASGIGKGKVYGGKFIGAGNKVGHDHEFFFFQGIHGFAHSGEIVEHILGPGGNGHSFFRPVLFKFGVFGFHEPQQVSDQPFFVHAVGGGNVPGAGDHAAIPGFPGNGSRSDFAGAFHTAGKDPQVGHNIIFPVHRAGGNHGGGRPLVHHACTGDALPEEVKK